MAVGGEAGARLLAVLDVTLSPDTLLNRLRDDVIPAGEPLRIVDLLHNCIGHPTSRSRHARLATSSENFISWPDCFPDTGPGGVSGSVLSLARCPVTRHHRVGRPDLTSVYPLARSWPDAVAWHLDRLGRSLTNLIELMTALNTEEVGFKSLTEQIDTTTSGGKLIFHIFRALAEFERELIRERTRVGLAAARARGRQGGRPKKLDTPKKIAMARSLYNAGTHSINDICQTLRVSRATLYRVIKIRD